MTVLKLDSGAEPSADAPVGNAPEPRPRRRRRRLLAVAMVVLLLAAGAYAVLRGDGESGSSPDSGYAVGCLAVGAAVPGRPPGQQIPAFRSVAESMGPLTMRRSFDRYLPSSFADSSAAADAAAGLHSFVSWKPPRDDYRGAAAGRYDRQIAAWARSVPRTGIYATTYHEPENNMSAADFVALQRHVYRVVKNANPTIHWGPVYMAYWWDPTQRSHYVGDPRAWWPGKGYADFVAVDWYGLDPTPMTTSRSFNNWYRTFRSTGLPLAIAEYGQYEVLNGQQPNPAKQRARARAIRHDADWLARHPQFKIWLYWQGGDNYGQWAMTDLASQEAWRSVAAKGCRP